MFQEKFKELCIQKALANLPSSKLSYTSYMSPLPTLRLRSVGPVTMERNVLFILS